jgi:hypothetical protein
MLTEGGVATKLWPALACHDNISLIEQLRYRTARSVPAMRVEGLAVPLLRGAEGWGPTPPLIPPTERPPEALVPAPMPHISLGGLVRHPPLPPSMACPLPYVRGARSRVRGDGPWGGRAITQVWPKHGLEPPLVVDLDCRLLARSTWRACLCRLSYERPGWVPLLPFFLLRGRVALMPREPTWSSLRQSGQGMRIAQCSDEVPPPR